MTNQDGTFVVLENDGIGSDLLAGKRWEPHFASFLSAINIVGTTAIDIGANIGCNTVHLARAVGPTGTVVAFEPQRIPFQQLCGSVILSGYPNVVAYQLAVGDKAQVIELEPVDFFATHVNVGNAGIGVGGETATMVTLDSLNVANVSLIKLDIQGAEVIALRGARGTIEREQPLIFLEIEEPQLRDRGTTPAELIGLVFSLGYVLIHIKSDYPVDFIALPHERKHLFEPITQALKIPTALCVP